MDGRGSVYKTYFSGSYVHVGIPILHIVAGEGILGNSIARYMMKMMTL